MTAAGQRAPVLFASSELHARELSAAELPLLQALFEANPEYFLAVNGRRAGADEAQVEFDERPPAHLGFGRRWFTGLFDRTDAFVGVAVVVSDLGAAGVWHIALFFLASRLHGQGLAGPLYHALESWMRGSGARWLRLGVVEGNQKAERFWARQGYLEVRRRLGVDTGGRINDVKLLVKAFAGAEIDEYLALVPRDRPDSTLP